MNYTDQDLINILALIGQSPLKGEQATTVALLQQKINTHLNELRAKSVPPEVPENVAKTGKSVPKANDKV